MDVAPLGKMVVTIGSIARLDGVPSGTRLVIDFVDVVVEGERLRAKKKQGAPAGDWLLIGPHDVATLDISLTLETDDGAIVHLYGLGRTNAATFAKGGVTWFTPLFETADPRYAWLNVLQGVARGTASGNVVTFELGELR